MHEASVYALAFFVAAHIPRLAGGLTRQEGGHMGLVPNTLEAACATHVRDAVDVLGPDHADRPAGAFEVEIEDADGETYVMRYADGDWHVERGFADDTPLLSVALGHGVFPVLARVLNAALDGFPHAPHLAAWQANARQHGQDTWDAVLDALRAQDDLGAHVELSGLGRVSFSAGVLDEVTRFVHVTWPAKHVDAILGGARLASVGMPRVTKGMSLLTALLSDVRPLLTKFNVEAL